MFITNENNYYFEVKCDIDPSKLVDCKIHESMEKMYEYVASELDLIIQDVEGLEVTIDFDSATQTYIESDSRGHGYSIDQGTSIEAYISEWEC